MQRRSLLLTAPRTLQWVSDDLLPPGVDEVLVETLSSAISIGSELARYRGSPRDVESPSYPQMTGYENVARVVACGEALRGVEVGQRVVATYGHRTHALLHAARLIPVPDDIPNSLALLAILSCDVEKGIRKVNPQPGEAVLITGAGTMGLLAVFMLRARGLDRIDVCEPHLRRREFALRLGARTAYSPDTAALAGLYTVAFECSDRDAAFHHLQERLAPGGRLCVLADGNLEPLTLTTHFHAKELQVVGSSDGWDYQAHARWYFDYLRRTPTPLADLFDHTIAPDDLISAFTALDSGRLDAIKVLVNYTGS